MVIKQEIVAQPFRTADGQPLNADRYLTLNLSDFAPDQLSEDCPSISLSISFARICEFVNTAGQLQEARESIVAKGARSTRQVKKRPLSSSSLEELKSEDEGRFRMQERAADTQADAQDTDFGRPRAKRRA
ncbi:hypothetical protein FDECE_7097 [Fusarium decemcellulare]|nr:hypothetical protein FDECE_7097 [Fusarium decemcellulare]